MADVCEFCQQYLSICVNIMFRELFPRMDIQLSPEIAIRLYYITLYFSGATKEMMMKRNPETRRARSQHS